MKIFIVSFLLLLSPFIKIFTQSISISPDGSPPDSSAILDIQSTTKGLLIPRMTQEQRDSIILPVLGLTIFQTDGITGMYYYDGSAWTPVGSSAPVGDWPQNGDDIYNGNPGNIGIGTSIPEGKVHVKGAADVSQLIIDASETQNDTNPLIRLRKSNGVDLIWINSDDSRNLFVGYQAGQVNLGALDNTFLGGKAGSSNISGSQNTATGAFALWLNTNGYYNTAMGFNALGRNTMAAQNTAIGAYALWSQNYNPGPSWVSNNVAVGYSALSSNQSTNISNGISNTAVGSYALFANTIGYDNTALGASALYSNTTATENTAIGRQALFYNTVGSSNTATGYKALRNNVFGHYNTATGNSALFGNSSGAFNSAYGILSLYSNTWGMSNTANGAQALYSNTTGNSNTAVGFGAHINNISGNYNVSIGYLSGTYENSTNLENTINIGNQGYLNQASNQAFIGNTSTNWIGGQTTWSTYASDARVKNNVEEDVKGLDFITKLKPVTYHLDITAMREITGNSDTEDYPEKYDIEKIKQSGFLAQEVEQAANASGYNFNGYTTPKKNTELYTMSYSLFVVPLVKATQELNTKVELLEEENQQLKSVITDLLSRIETLEKRID